MAIVPLERKPLSFAERTYLPAIASGLKTTLQHLFKPNITMEYPEQRPAIPPGYRGVPTLVKDPHGREKCVSCQLCEFVCPPKAIRITPGAIATDAATGHVEKAPEAFEIDMLRCIYCGRGGLPGGGDLPPAAVFHDRLHPRGDGERQGPSL